MLAMSFTGKKATQFKEAFIKQFNLMEEELKKYSTARTPILIPTYQLRILSQPTQECPDDRWSIFDQSHDIMLFVEKHVGSVNQYDLVDGSIGIHWSKYRQGKTWAKTVTQYYHQFSDKRGKQMASCFDYQELPHFKAWLKNQYKKFHLGDYLINKFTRDKTPSLLEKAKGLMPKLINAAAL